MYKKNNTKQLKWKYVRQFCTLLKKTFFDRQWQINKFNFICISCHE